MSLASVWAALLPNQFRVFTIAAIDEQMYIELKTLDHDTVASYYAVSYAWGSPVVTSHIECSGATLHITENVQKCLEALHKLYPSLAFFVEYLCINQQHNTEKAQQVANMHRVYENAEQVVAWLGEAAADSDIAMTYIRSLSREDLIGIPDHGVTISKADLGNDSFVQRMSTPCAAAIYRLGYRPWFTRLWIMQEILLARNLRFACGSLEVEGSLFIQFCLLMNHLHIPTWLRIVRGYAIEKFPGQKHGFLHLGTLAITRRFRDTPVPTPLVKSNFAMAVHNARGLETSEPVDRVYALLGCDNLGVYRETLQIDYSDEARRDYLRLYVKFAKIALKIQARLFLLLMTSSLERPLSLPSWCPNLVSNAETDWIFHRYEAGWPHVDHENRLELAGSSRPCDLVHSIFAANMIQGVGVSDDSDWVYIMGAEVDIVAIVGPPNPFHDNTMTGELGFGRNSEWYKATGQWLSESQAIFGSINPASSDSILPFWYTITGDLSAKSLKMPAEQNDIDCAQALPRYMEMLQDLEHGSSQLEYRGPRPTEYADLRRLYDWQAFWALLQQIWSRRVMFSTTSGRLGFASARVKPGDKVCAFYNGSCLYLLREQIKYTHGFEFVDCAYLHGLINGEVFELLHSEETREKCFAVL